MIKKRSLLDKLGGKTTTQLPAASVNSALGRSVGSYQPSIQPIQQPIIPKPILPSVNLSRPITRDLGTPTLRESTQRSNAKQSEIDRETEKQTKQNASDRAKMLERQISDKYGIDVKRANSPIEAVNMLSMVDDSRKEQFKKDFAEYSFAAERSNPFRAGAEAGFNIFPTNLEKTEGKEDVQGAKGYGAGRLVGGIGQQLAFNSVLGPGIESLTSKLLPKATPFVTETIKDVAIGTGTQLAEAPFDKPTAGQFAGNIALDIALNALFGVVGKGLSKVDLSNLKTAKPSQVVGDVAEKLNVSIVEADKLVDDAIDFYVNQSGVADTKPFEQLQLEAPKTKDLSDVSNTLSSKLMAKQSDLYVNQFDASDTKPFKDNLGNTQNLQAWQIPKDSKKLTLDVAYSGVIDESGKFYKVKDGEHHTELLDRLWNQGKINVNPESLDPKQYDVMGFKFGDTFVSLKDLDSTGGDIHEAIINKAVLENKPISKDVLQSFGKEAPVRTNSDASGMRLRQPVNKVVDSVDNVKPQTNKLYDFDGNEVAINGKTAKGQNIVSKVNSDGSLEYFGSRLYTDDELSEFVGQQKKIIDSINRGKEYDAKELFEKEKETFLNQQKEDLRGFDSNKTPMQIGKVKQSLLKPVRWTSGAEQKTGTIKDYIEDVIRSGRKPITKVINGKNEYRLISDDGTFRILNKTEYEYADYIKDKVNTIQTQEFKGVMQNVEKIQPSFEIPKSQVGVPKVETKPQLDRPSEFSIGAKYPPLAKDFARDVTKPARPRIEPTLKPIDRPSDFSVKKPIYPTLDPKFAKERPSVLTASDMKRIEPTLNVASKVDQPTTTMKIEPTLKPKKVEAKQPSDAKMKFRKTITNSFQKSQLSDEAKIVFDENPREYEIYTNPEQWEKAFDKVSADVDGSIKTFNSKSALENADDTAEGIALMNRLSSEDRIDELINVADTFSERATNAGQAVQAIVMLQKTTPEGKLVQSINVVKNAKKQLESDMPDLYNKLKKDGKLPEITKDDAQFIVDQMKKAQELTGRARDIEIGKVDQLLANKIPATFGDKVRAIRNLSLLGNIKTVFTRNPLGNLIFAGLENLSQIPSGLTDKIVSNALKTTRTTKVLPSIGTQVKGFKKGFSEALSDIKLGIDTSPVRGGAELPRSKKVFEIALLNKANNWLGNALKLGDRPFYQAAYDLRLKELQELMPDADPKDLDLLAKEFGLSRTFQNDGSTSKAFKKVKDAFNTANIKGVGFGDVVMPYTQTPANILAKGVQYTPLNIIQIAKIASGGTENIARNQKAFVDAIGRTFTGSGIIALGYALAKNGYITGKNQDTSPKAKALKKDIGQQQYSIKIGDTWYSYDWAQPASIPLAVGVDFFNAGASEKDILTAIEKGSISGGETLLQQGLLQGVMRMFGGYSPIENVIETIGTSPTQFLPTLGNQAAQMKDEYKRDVNYKGSVGDQLLDLSKRRIPGVRETLPATLNMWGEPVKEQQGRTGLEKAFDVFVNPSLKSKESNDPILQEVNKVFKETKDTSVIPSYTPSALTSSDETRNFKMIYGPMAKSELETLFRSSTYKGSREQNKLIKKVLDKLQDKAKDAYNLKYKTDLR